MNLVRTFLDTIDISSFIISSTSENLFHSVASVLASKGYSFPRHTSFHAEWIIVPFTLILAAPVRANLETAWWIVFISEIFQHLLNPSKKNFGKENCKTKRFKTFLFYSFLCPKISKFKNLLLFKIQWSKIGLNFIIVLTNILICEWIVSCVS